MRALTIEGPGRFELKDRPRPSVPESGVLLAPIAVGLCGTDRELLNGTMAYIRAGRTTFPLIPGHEWVATVVEPGGEASGFAKGDVVVGECSIGCGECDFCASGAYQQCPNRRETGVLGLDGALAGFLVMPSTSLHHVSASVAADDAVFTEPTAVALRAVLRADPPRGSRALIVGGGTIGWLIAAILITSFGVDVAISEPDPQRRDRLVALGARSAIDGETFAAVFEASGTRAGAKDALSKLAGAGTLVVVGLSGGGAISLDLDDLVVSDQTIIGSLGSPGVWPAALELLASGRIRPSQLITDRFALAEVETGIERLGGAGVGKVVIYPGADDRR